MAVTVRGTDILFNDGTTQSTAAGAITTTSVLNATAGASVGAVGSYAYLVSAVTGATAPGGTKAGSSLRYASSRIVGAASGATSGSPIPAGTWRCMGYDGTFTDAYNNVTGFATLWLRIS